MGNDTVSIHEADVIGLTHAIDGLGRLYPVLRIRDTVVESENGSKFKATLIPCDSHGQLFEMGIGIGSRVQFTVKDTPEIIERSDDKRENAEIPSVCPRCSRNLLTLPMDSSNRHWSLFCSNYSCPSRIVSSIVHYFNTINEKNNLSISLAKDICDKLFIRKIPDIYRLTLVELAKIHLTEKEGLLTLGIIHGLESSIAQLDSPLLMRTVCRAILRKKKVPLAQFVLSMGISGMDEISSRNLCRVMRSLKGITKAPMHTLAHINGIGDNLAFKIYHFFVSNISVVEEILSFIDLKDEASGPLAGKMFAVTGTIYDRYNHVINRHEITKMVENAGGIVENHVTSRLRQRNGEQNHGFVIAGREPGSKINKAKSLGIEIITYDDLINMIEPSSSFSDLNLVT